jgi:hypothetical protein
MKRNRELYLWYPVVLLFPWVHELGHCCIAWALGYRVTELHLTYMNYLRPVGDLVNVFQGMWEWSCVIPMVSVFVWFYLAVRDVREVSCVRVYSGSGYIRSKDGVSI